MSSFHSSVRLLFSFSFPLIGVFKLWVLRVSCSETQDLRITGTRLWKGDTWVLVSGRGQNLTDESLKESSIPARGGVHGNCLFLCTVKRSVQPGCTDTVFLHVRWKRTWWAQAHWTSGEIKSLPSLFAFRYSLASLFSYILAFSFNFCPPHRHHFALFFDHTHLLFLNKHASLVFFDES